MLAVYTGKKYYLLPSWATNVDNYLSVIGNSTEVELECLNEISCFAPVFLEDSITKETVNPAELPLMIPVNVEVLSKEDYDRRLTERVRDFCPSCESFIDDGAELDLSGHYDEMPVRGNCLIYGSDSHFAARARNFWNIFLNEAEEIKSFVDKNKPVFARNRLLKLYRRYYYIADIEIRKTGDTYRVVFFSDGNTVLSLAAQYLLDIGPLLYEWEFCTYFERREDFVDSPPVFLPVFAEDEEVLKVKYYLPPEFKTKHKLTDEDKIFRYFYRLIGEREAYVMEFHESLMPLENAMTAAQFREFAADYIEEQDLRITDRGWERKFIFEPYPNSDEERIKSLKTGQREDIIHSMTMFPDMLIEQLEGKRDFCGKLREDGIYAFYLTLRLDEFEDYDAPVPEEGSYLTYAAALIESNLHESASCASIGISMGEEYIYLDYLVFDTATFLTALRSMTPLLERHNVTLTEFDPAAAPTVLNYDLKPLH